MKAKEGFEEVQRGIIVYGLDDRQKPRAGCFFEQDYPAARKAAEKMKLETFVTTSDELGPIFKRVAVGNLSESGYGFIGRMRTKDYVELVTLIASLRSSAAISYKGCLLPTSWEEIKKDSFVIAQADSAEYGWWPAVVTERVGKILTLRWQNFPKDPKFKRHVNSVALVQPTTVELGEA